MFQLLFQSGSHGRVIRSIGTHVKLALIICLLGLISSCASTSDPSDAAYGKEPIYIDEQSKEEKEAAQQAVYDGLTRGINQYLLSPGDNLDILFHINSVPGTSEYVLSVGDVLNVDFFYNEKASRTVVIRPDGKITLPIKGDMIAAGLTPSHFTENIRNAYKGIFSNPAITVSVEEYTSPLDDLTETLTNYARGQGRSKKFEISPDGYIFLPYLPGIKAAGKTVDEVRENINKGYLTKYQSLSVTVILDKIVSNRVFVFGEVPKPGAVNLKPPYTAIQAIASAGGPLPTASDYIKILYRGVSNEPRIRTINWEELVESNQVEQDMLVPRNSTIYVPPSSITTADRAIDQYIKQLFLFNGTSLGFTYQINDTTITTTP